MGRSGQIESHSLLYIQVPFRVLIASNVTLIIKVFKNVKSGLPNEANKVWLSGRPTDITLTRNILKKYEGFALINFSDTFWKHKAKCGQVFMPAVQFYQPDPVQVVDDRFVQIIGDK